MIYGIINVSRLEFSNGITLFPFGDLPDSPNARVLKQNYLQIDELSNFGFEPCFASASRNYKVRTTCKSEAEDFDLENKIRRTVAAMVLDDELAPYVGPVWHDFDSSVLAQAEYGRGWRPGGGDVVRGSSFPRTVTPNTVKWVERYLALSSSVRHRCDLALERLGQSERRSNPGNIAIDGCICLESLLGDKESTEIGYKVRLRSALILGNNIDERKSIMRDVSQFYNLRSKVVHGTLAIDDTNRSKWAEVADRGLKVCKSITRYVVMNNAVPDPVELELSGGESSSDVII